MSTSCAVLSTAITLLLLATTSGTAQAREPLFRKLRGNSSTDEPTTQVNETLAIPLSATVGAGAQVPPWCKHIPVESLANVSACGGSARPNNKDVGGGTVPSWCQDIPAQSQATVPSCVVSAIGSASSLSLAPTPPPAPPAASTSGVMDVTFAASATPSWCNDIPSASHTYIAACGGSGSGTSSNNDGNGAIPSWCQNIPSASRGDVPSCAASASHIDHGTALSASMRLTQVSGVAISLGVLYFAWFFSGTP